jgi:(E)-4-hydroxy-3-methylbut-2-enyl-diphosphate synthase
MTKHPYVPSIFAFERRKTRVVSIGGIAVGGSEPIRVQSMTTTPTWDARATVDQIVKLVDVGCEIVRVTVPSKKDAEALPEIREALLKKGLSVPLIADIHFAPALAMFCVDHVDKVRINPGNYVDAKKFQVIEYSDEDYNDELKRLEDAFTPLVLKAKDRGISMRIGTNHGSLSDRILNRYGDTPLGMVESALEFVRIGRSNDYHELIMSMKASNPIVMIQAYRLLAAHMSDQDMDYPFHLGVTEAGDGLDARVKSAVGIGSLLLDGIGDTIRVSLTEDPCAEVPVGFDLAKLVAKLESKLLSGEEKEQREEFFDPYEFNRRPSHVVDFGGIAYGKTAVPRVEADLGVLYRDPDYEVPRSETGDGLEMLCARVETMADLVHIPALSNSAFAMQAALSVELAESVWQSGVHPEIFKNVQRIELQTAAVQPENRDVFESWLKLARESECGISLRVCESTELSLLEAAKNLSSDLALVIPLEAMRDRGLERAREVFSNVRGLEVPVILSWDFSGVNPVLAPAMVIGGLLCDGLGDALRMPIRTEYSGVDPANVAYTLLQATRYRTVRTEYVSCPSCGRTLFDLEETTAKIKELTGHLPNVTIAIMGCIVNGPGEMADADFGYVGWKPGKVDLWVGKEVVEKAIPEAEAPSRLVDLLKKHGVWEEPAVTV